MVLRSLPEVPQPPQDQGVIPHPRSLNHCCRYALFDKGKEMQITSEPFLLDNKKYDIDLSIVVPAYNEVQRLPTMMNETLPV